MSRSWFARGWRLGVLSAATAAAVTLTPAMAIAAQDHRVRPGDTLWDIARRYGVSVEGLARANGIADPHRIISGSTIVVGSGGGSAPSGGGSTHRVAPGETLSHVAARYGVSVSALMKANGLTSPHRILAGSSLRLPSGTQTRSSAASGGTGESVFHTVTAGQTLSGIAARYRVPVSAIADANDLQSRNHILAGSRLKIPVAGRPSPAAPARGEVERLLEDAARRHGWDPNLIKAISWQESGWNNAAVSSVGAVGIMQVLPSTNREVSQPRAGRTFDLNRPADNIEAGMQYMELLRELTGGDTEAILAGYYQGLRSVRQNGLYPSTEQYIANILALRDRFAAGG